MTRTATALQAVGLAAVSYGIGMRALWVGIVAGGLSLVLLGLALERQAAEHDEGQP